MKGTNTLMEFASVDPTAQRRMKNFTPHPIKVLAYPRCWYGAPATEEELAASDWVREVLNDGREITGGYLTIPTEATGAVLRCDTEGGYPAPLRLTETDDASERGITIGVDFAIETNGLDIETGVVTRSYSAPETLPDEERGMTLIVSLPFLMGLAAAGVYRDDLVAPDTGPTALRDEQGRIDAVRGFVRIARPAS